MALNPKERFDSFMRLADFRMQRWSTRHQLKWKTTLGVWAVLGASIYSLKIRPSEGVLIASLAGVALFHFAYVLHSIVSTHHDMRMAFYYSEHAEKSLFSPPADPRARPEYRPLARSAYARLAPAAFLEVMPTVGLAVLAYALIGRIA
ncbi:MAG: hypothetical protein A4S14_08990 [Proteobacteria bacterium SG_bin9]|nr:MAG: hypothetical protein A4S14_08990 [Proteobacteria bacterium SG_bin9]